MIYKNLNLKFECCTRFLKQLYLKGNKTFFKSLKTKECSLYYIIQYTILTMYTVFDINKNVINLNLKFESLTEFSKRMIYIKIFLNSLSK